MGAVAQEYSDHIVITNDNPRTEGEMQIINDILSGMDAQGQFIIEPDREKAIHIAVAEIKNNSDGGVMLIAGKGHETYQEIDGNLFEFNDKEIVQSSMGL
jgi:UDP-N-acetylmuramoyl-L-alanyl-D-glutamate--2,6-diaminopimelate ligase